LKTVDYPSRIADQQVNWIGKSNGAEVDFKVDCKHERITVFTTRPDTLFGATFMVLAPEHELVSKITTAEQKEKVSEYVKSAQSKSDIERQENKEKTGVFTGAYAINPVNDEKVPIWISDYVLMGYGTGAIMAVPAHDERDFEFAQKFGIEIKQVVAPLIHDTINPVRAGKKDTDRQVAMCIIEHPEKDEFLTLKYPKRGWHNFVMGGIEDGETAEEAAAREIIEETGYTNFELVETMPLKINSRFFAAHKDVNRNIITTVVRFKLKDLKQQKTELSKVEQKEEITPAWTKRKDLQTLQPVSELPYILDWLAGKTLCFHEDGTAINSGEFSGQNTADVKTGIINLLTKKKAGKEKVQYKLRDWIFSRQHYWGEPIPIIHCPEHGAVPVPEEDLPVELPPVDHYEPTDTGESPLAAIPDWVNTTCPICGQAARRETDTMPNWAGSDWYYLRYFDAHNNQAFANPEKLKYWLPVDLYLGGMEHTTLHLLYSRFWHQFLYDQKLVPTPEPYAQRRAIGIILAADGRKMSKSYGNVVDPIQIIDSGYGADATRLAVTFLAPYDQTTAWSPEGVAGCYRFLTRVWNLINEPVDGTKEKSPSDDEIKKIINKTVKKVSEDIDRMNFNTAIAALMETLNELSKISDKYGKVWHDALKKFIQLLAPFAPHIAEEVWQGKLAEKSSIHLADWPKFDEKLLVEDTVKIGVQINGKLRGEIEVAKTADEKTALALANKADNVATYLEGKTPRKVIYVPGRILNIIL
jgi:leucyl-tRNA synthetase